MEGGISDDYIGSGEAPYIIEQPLDVTVARHQPATLNCRAGGSPTPVIKWYKGGVLVVSDTHRSLLPAGGLFFLRATHGRAHSDAGVYWCEATNPFGTARSRNATLHVAGKCFTMFFVKCYILCIVFLILYCSVQCFERNSDWNQCQHKQHKEKL